MSRQFLIKFRVFNDWSQNTFAQLLGVSLDEYQAIEERPFKMRNPQFLKIIHFFKSNLESSDARRAALELQKAIHFDHWYSQRLLRLQRNHVNLRLVKSYAKSQGNENDESCGSKSIQDSGA